MDVVRKLYCSPSLSVCPVFDLCEQLEFLTGSSCGCRRYHCGEGWSPILVLPASYYIVQQLNRPVGSLAGYVLCVQNYIEIPAAMATGHFLCGFVGWPPSTWPCRIMDRKSRVVFLQIVWSLEKGAVYRPYSHKLLTINNYVSCLSNFAFARSIYLFHPPIFEKILMRILSIVMLVHVCTQPESL